MYLDKLEGWSVGQTVVEEGRGASLAIPKLVKITKLTAAWGGTVYIGDRAYNKHGHSRGSGDWSGFTISPATPAIVKNVNGQRAKAFLCSIRWDDLTDDQSIQMYTEYRKIKPADTKR